MTFGERLSNLLSARKITQTELAKSIDIRLASISEWKKGTILPAVDTVIKIANFLDISTDYLLRGEEAVSKEVENFENIAKIEKLQEENKNLKKELEDLKLQLKACSVTTEEIDFLNRLKSLPKQQRDFVIGSVDNAYNQLSETIKKEVQYVS